MSTFPFDAFIDLVRFDQEMQKTKKDIELQKMELQHQKEQKQALIAEHELLKKAVHDTQKEVHEKELEMKKLDARESEIKKKLDSMTKVKEYAPLKKELETIQAAQLAHEDELVSVWNQLETSQRTMSQKEGVVQEKITEIEQMLATKQQEIEQLEKKVATDQKERSKKTEQIPSEWLEKYEVMHGRVTDPVVEVVHGGCGGCFYPIPDQDLLRLRKRALLQCNSCYRFLYDPEIIEIKPPEPLEPKSEEAETIEQG